MRPQQAEACILTPDPQAQAIGNTASIPLGISSFDVQLGALLHETPHSTVHKVAAVSHVCDGSRL